jgi:rare lipoprotein A
VLAALMAGCASGPRSSSPGSSSASVARPGRDGADANPPANLAQVPDAEPRVEPIRSGGPNKPYVVLGRAYTPLQDGRPFRESGLASWYGRKFHGVPTSSGEPYDMYGMTAAHTTLPIPSYVRVRNPANGREVIVRINDRGPFHDGRVIDLSYTAAYKLDLLRGVAPVELERITPDEIVAGSWRRGNTGTALAYAAPTVPVSATLVRPVAYVPPPPAAPPAVAPVRRPAAPVVPPVAVAAAAVVPPPPVESPPAPAFYAAPVQPATPPAYDPTAEQPLTAVALTADMAPVDTAPPPRGAVGTPLPPLPPLVPVAPPAPQAPAPAAVTPAMAPSQSPPLASAGAFWVQLGAFGRPDSAAALQQRVAGSAGALAPTVAVVSDGGLHRVQAGPYPTREAARSAADRLGGSLQLSPVVVERR